MVEPDPVPGNAGGRDRANPDAGTGGGRDACRMEPIRRLETRIVHPRQPIVAVTVGFGLAYLALLAGFALAFERPPALGWAGFGVVGAIVLVTAIVVGRFLTGSDRRS